MMNSAGDQVRGAMERRNGETEVFCGARRENGDQNATDSGRGHVSGADLAGEAEDRRGFILTASVAGTYSNGMEMMDCMRFCAEKDGLSTKR